MASITDRLAENVPGLFYVDGTCIDCDRCRDDSPAFFRRNDDIGSSVVHRQPVTAEEIDLCQEAMMGCPTESIGREDG